MGAGADAVNAIGGVFGFHLGGSGGNSSGAPGGFWQELMNILSFFLNPSRIIFVIIGILMVTAAVFYFINSSKVVQSVTETVKPLADTAAKAAALAAA